MNISLAASVEFGSFDFFFFLERQWSNSTGAFVFCESICSPMVFADFMSSVESENIKSLYTLLSSPRLQIICFKHMTLM